jgi:transposase-like protein
LDRAVVRFVSSETGGPRSPRFVTARVLAFEARLEALADPNQTSLANERPYLDRHVRAALERHISETVLANLRIEPAPTEDELDRQSRDAKRMLVERVGGAAALAEAARAEGIGESELLALVRRQARASLYLDRMVLPMLTPSEAELRAVHRTVETPFRNQPYATVAASLRRWYVSRRLATALDAFFQGARARIEVTPIPRAPTP